MTRARTGAVDRDLASSPAAAPTRSGQDGGLAAWWHAEPRLLVVAASEAAAADRHAIKERGIPSRALMQRAGAATAARVLALAPERLASGVAVLCGGGNNGGDGWVIARTLAAAGVRVRVDEVVAARTPDCQAERELTLPAVRVSADDGGEGIAVDALLGTGASGPPRGAVVEGLRRLAALRARGALVVAVDVPSALDATTGHDAGAVPADETVTFGTLKRGLLAARDVAGRIAVVDIGLGDALDAIPGAPRLADAALVRHVAAPFAVDAHKGVRRKLALVGGAEGMAGAIALAARAALRSGVGMTRAVVQAASIPALQAAVPAATCSAWPTADDALRREVVDWAHGVVIGPGLGCTEATRALVERVLRAWQGPVVLDADALNVFEGDLGTLTRLLDGRPAAVTPHVAEFARLAGVRPDEVRSDPYAAARDLATRLGAVVLLKGVPTVVADPGGRTLVSATGTAALATAGSGDLLAGIAGTLLAQRPECALEAVAAAAWAHGRAGELASAAGVRGVLLDDILAALPQVWAEPPAPPAPHALAELPAVGARRLPTEVAGA